MGTELPRDYKDLASSYGPGAFGDFIHVFHPHAATEWVDLAGPVPATVRRQLQQDRDHGSHPVPHDPQRLFTIGVTDNGEYLFWITEPVSKPNAWRIAVNEARGPGDELIEITKPRE